MKRNQEGRALRKASLIVSVALAAGIIGVGAPGASADAATYGQCVATGLVDPSSSIFGPGGFDTSSHTPTFSSGVINAIIQSDGTSHFTGGMNC